MLESGPAWTSPPIENSVHWMGTDFSSNGWMCVNLCSPLCCWSFLWLFFCWLFFFGNSEITCPATYYLPSWPYLPTKNQLPPATYLLDSHPLFPRKRALSDPAPNSAPVTEQKVTMIGVNTTDFRVSSFCLIIVNGRQLLCTCGRYSFYFYYSRTCLS